MKLEYAGFVGQRAVDSRLQPFSEGLLGFKQLHRLRAGRDRCQGVRRASRGFNPRGSGSSRASRAWRIRPYDSAGHILNLWDVDVSYHKGNWDARFELADMNQQTAAQPIHRFGYYAQLAYRQYNNPNPILQKLEGVFRFDHTQFDGINLRQTGINFGGYDNIYARMPLDRNRFTYGVNYWFTPSLALKLAIEIYDELGVPSLRDNGFIGQVTWGW